jgi:hypothetical protein
VLKGDPWGRSACSPRASPPTRCSVAAASIDGRPHMVLKLPRAAAACFVLVGCAVSSPDNTAGLLGAGAGPYPTDYRKIAHEFVRLSFNDPHSIRDAQIAPPKLSIGPSLLGNGVMATPWIVCMRADARNALGAYTGLRETAIQVYQGRGVGSWDQSAVAKMDPFWPCNGAQYEPFTEVMS